MTTAFGPQGPNYAASRPTLTADASGGVDTWFRDCSAQGATDGTYVTSDFLNVLVDQLRTAVRTAGVPLNKTNSLMLWQAMLASGNASIALVYVASTQSVTVPAASTRALVKVWGAGGGGGSTAAVTYTLAQGGGGGEYREGLVSVTPGASLTAIVGAAGYATAGANNGTNGGSSSFGGITASGGGGGNGSASGVASTSGGAGGVSGWGGNFAVAGGGGEIGISNSGLGVLLGLGGGSSFGIGHTHFAFTAGTSVTGASGGSPGQGGAPGMGGGEGGNGAAGLIVIEFLP